MERIIDFLKSKFKLLLIILSISLILLILILPLDVLEYLSIEIVGEPPINGKTWIEGVESLGGEFSMRFLAIIGLLIITLIIPLLLRFEKPQIIKRKVSKTEILVFIITTISFFIGNLLIGYDWWNPDAFLGMGPLFLPSIISLIIIGVIPDIIKRIYGLKGKDLAQSTKNISIISIFMILIGFGYGLISLIWHCCSFFEPKMFFFFFVIKLIQLFGMCSFFFRWGFRLFLNRVKEWQAYLITSVLFGICYPWHTFGFAITFMFFGFLICYLTRKTDSYFTGLILLYFAYIFHAGLAWHGPTITFTVIYPISISIFVCIAIYTIVKFLKSSSKPLKDP
ncbi:MAG: hypothetical protein GF329_19730 [Candidatus Lokiarchaeota archaeon]|nr:hypothetical protein [Candidatus Lokiarchaeota archaeon]